MASAPTDLSVRVIWWIKAVQERTKHLFLRPLSIDVLPVVTGIVHSEEKIDNHNLKWWDSTPKNSFREMLEYHFYYQHLHADNWQDLIIQVPLVWGLVHFILQSNSFERLGTLVHVLVSPHFSVLQMTKAEQEQV